MIVSLLSVLFWGACSCSSTYLELSPLPCQTEQRITSDSRQNKTVIQRRRRELEIYYLLGLSFNLQRSKINSSPPSSFFQNTKMFIVPTSVSCSSLPDSQSTCRNEFSMKNLTHFTDAAFIKIIRSSKGKNKSPSYLWSRFSGYFNIVVRYQ